MIIVQDFFMITPLTSASPPPQGEITFEPQTVVVPPQDNPPPTAAAPMDVPQTAPPVRPGSPWPKRLITLFIILLLVVGAIFGGRWLFGMFEGSKEVTITYWGLWENDATIKPLIASFETANPKIKVQYIKQSQKQYRERLQAAIDRGEGPDVFRFHNTWVPMLAKELEPIPETVMPVSEFQSTFFEITLEE